jgi:hypothetical protein
MDSQTKKIMIGGLAGVAALALIGGLFFGSNPDPTIKVTDGNSTSAKENNGNVITISKDTVIEDLETPENDSELISKLKSPIPTPIPPSPIPPTPSNIENNTLANAMDYNETGIDLGELPAGSNPPSRRPMDRISADRMGGGGASFRRKQNSTVLHQTTPRPEATQAGPTPTPDPYATPTPVPTETPEATPTETPIQGSARIYLEPSSVTITPGEIATLDLYIQVWEKAAAGYTTLILYNPVDIQVKELLQGRDPYLGYPLVYDVNPQRGSVTLSSAQGTALDRPTGIIHLANIQFTGSELGSHFLELAESEISNTEAQTMKLKGEFGATIIVQTPVPEEDISEDDTPQE